MKITAHTKLTGLFGHPTGHSLSPVFMNFLFEHTGIDARYFAFDVRPAHIIEAVHSLKVLGFAGANVTIPHKRTVFDALDRVSEDAAAIGAVNCIVHTDGVLEGHNTDHLGFMWPLREAAFLRKNDSVLIIGCGGAARAVLYALVQSGVGDVYVANRTASHAHRLIEWAEKTLGIHTISYAGEPASLDETLLRESHLVVNTTPVGMFPDTGACPLSANVRFREDQTVYDLIYTPARTRLLHMAREAGARTLNGLEMLVVQGLLSAALWFPQSRNKIMVQRSFLLDHLREHTHARNP
jgi:shikimate dehydrogenase